MFQKESKFSNDTINRILNAEKMTPDRLRSFPGFEQIDENEAQQIIETLENYCGIIVKHVSKNRDYG
jgi:hypothetical protein